MNKNNPADRLRIIRKSKGWSLQDVELHSNGKWKAVVIGSYERADRAISTKKSGITDGVLSSAYHRTIPRGFAPGG